MARRKSRNVEIQVNNHIIVLHENEGDVTSLHAETLINNCHFLCHIDCSSGNNILPAKYAGGLKLRRSEKILYAANRTQINILGKCYVTAQFGNYFKTKAKFFVSDAVHEALYTLHKFLVEM